MSEICFSADTIEFDAIKMVVPKPLMLPSAKPKVRYIAALDEVMVTRDGDYARIEYKEAGVAVTTLEIGREIAEMSDSEILEADNQGLRSLAKQAADYKHAVFEVPWAQRKSNILLNEFQEVVSCAA